MTVMRSARGLATPLLDWYDHSRRDLPWRVARDAPPGHRPDPYHVLVSEAMLQQTQVVTVIPYFRRFLERFPSLRSLADSQEQDVLRLWQGLGYYSRARNLRRAAQVIVARHGGVVPSDVASLLELPGVGRYTAGAIASLAYDTRAPILDGNVARVLCRIERIQSDPRQRETTARLWQLAEQILPQRRAGDFNSALMELGATVCTPRSPQCLICPVRACCQAQQAGVQDRIPPVRKARPTPLLKRATFCIRQGDGDGRYLIEQRPLSGRWAGMWQFVTLDPQDHPHERLHDQLPVPVSRSERLGVVTHGLTHRRYHFDVYTCQTPDGRTLPAGCPLKWVTLQELSDYPLPRPHLKIAGMLGKLP